MVYVDPLSDGADGIERRLHEIAAAVGAGRPGAGRPGRRAGLLRRRRTGPILATSPRSARCPIDEVIALHLAREYRVFVVGFVPGFAYMASVDPRIAAPRRSSPRLQVPAGSVAVAAGQTGVYPAETPGGWSLIGRCPIKPYDADRGRAVPLSPGDRVRFHRISDQRTAPPPSGVTCELRRPRSIRLPVVKAGDADDGAGSRARGLPGTRRAGVGTDGRVLAPAGQPGARQRSDGRGAGDHAARAGASR